MCVYQRERPDRIGIEYRPFSVAVAVAKRGTRLCVAEAFVKVLASCFGERDGGGLYSSGT